MSEVKALTNEILKFRNERDWAQFHTPRNLAAAMAIEVAELQELMLWKTDHEVEELLGTEKVDRIHEEIADVLIFALLFCDSVGIDPADAVRNKLELNASKYPVDLSKGNAKKYTDL